MLHIVQGCADGDANVLRHGPQILQAAAKPKYVSARANILHEQRIWHI
jgi:hypothetical protein